MTHAFSLISPMYNVAGYLRDFLRSLEEQSFGIENIQLVLVDDGSTDDSAAIAEAFAARHPANVLVLRKENGGQASARNLGLEHATGTWVTFPDPDDVLAPDYLSNVAQTLDDDVTMATARMLLWWEGSDELTRHALDYRFNDGQRLVSLGTDPTIIQAHVTTGFFRREVVRDHALTFREELRYRFEDGNFVTRYLLAFEDPRVSMVPSAAYFYRQRADSSSTVQASKQREEKYLAPLEHGYPDVIRAAQATGRPLPLWAQNLMMYDQYWILRSSQTRAVRIVTFSEDFLSRIPRLVHDFLQHIDDELIRSFELLPVPVWMPQAFLLAKHPGTHTQPRIQRVDARRGLVEIVYLYSGDAPAEEISDGVRVLRPRHVKDYRLEYAGSQLATQRTLWLATDEGFSITLDGIAQEILPRGGSESVPRIGRRFLRDAGIPVAASDTPLDLPTLPAFAATRDKDLGVAVAPRMARGKTLRAKIARARQRGLIDTARLLAHRTASQGATRAAGYREKFRHAWLMIDRDTDANDSAEDLYFWLKENRPDINSWFVIRKDSPDWERLKARGVRLIAYGTPEHAAALRHADHVASSHADRFVSDPFPKSLMKKADFSFTFLQHGVIKGDISTWLNTKNLSTLVTSTEAEYDYIAGPGPYKFSGRETRLCGLPRFDTLLRMSQEVAPAERNVILVMPTWRDYLVGAMTSRSNDRGLSADFLSTDYAVAWSAFLRDEAFLAEARARGQRIVFMPHPNMRGYLASFDLPEAVEITSYDDVDVRSLFVRASLLVTDYSSTAFNVAYLDVPVLYYQFDRTEYFIGHTERPGYFEYERDGFGPVALTAEEASAQLRAILRGEIDDVYADRRAQTFPVRDGRNSERVVEAMIDSRTLVPRTEIGVAAPPDRWKR